MQITGKVIDTKLYQGVSKNTGREWKSKEIVIEYEDMQYIKNLCVELFGEDKITNNPCRKGQNVTIEFSIESTQWNDRWYTKAAAWRISPADKDTTPKPIAHAAPVASPADEVTDLPF